MHEAAHASMAILMDRRVERVEVDPGMHLPGEEAGRTIVPVDVDRIEVSQLAVCLAGYLSDGAPDWPPPWPEALEEEREALGLVLKLMQVDEASYLAAIERVRAILDHPNFKRLQSGIARALATVPVLTQTNIERIARGHGFAPAEEPDLCPASP